MKIKPSLKSQKKGFTLVEMIIVIAILIILVALIAPKFLGYSDKARHAVAETNAKAIVTAIGLYQAEEGKTKTTFSTGDLDKYLSSDNQKVTYQVSVSDKGILSGTVTTDEIIITLGSATKPH